MALPSVGYSNPDWQGTCPAWTPESLSLIPCCHPGALPQDCQNSVASLLFPLRMFTCSLSETLFPALSPCHCSHLPEIYSLVETRIRKSVESGHGKGLKFTLSTSSIPIWLVSKWLIRILLWGRGAIINSLLSRLADRFTPLGNSLCVASLCPFYQ